MVSQFTGYPVEELMLRWLTVLINSHLSAENLYLKLTTRVSWPTGKLGNLLIVRLNLIGKWVNYKHLYVVF